MIALGAAMIGFFAIAVIIGQVICTDFTRLQGQPIVDYRVFTARLVERLTEESE